MIESLKHALKLQKEAASFHSAFKQVETEETALVTQKQTRTCLQ